MTRLTSSLSSWLACLSKFSVAKAIRPSRLTVPRPPAAKGFATLATLGSVLSSSSSLSMRCRVAGSASVPESALKTTWLESPACWGNRSFRRSTACWDSLPLSEKLSTYPPPDPAAAAPARTTSPIQRPMTRR